MIGYGFCQVVEVLRLPTPEEIIPDDWGHGQLQHFIRPFFAQRLGWLGADNSAVGACLTIRQHRGVENRAANTEVTPVALQVGLGVGSARDRLRISVWRIGRGPGLVENRKGAANPTNIRQGVRGAGVLGGLLDCSGLPIILLRGV